MRIRTDFVSNSSSSSFICIAADAKDIELFNKSELLSLHEYLERFGEREVFYNNWWLEHSPKMKFVSNERLCKMFATGISNTLPKSAKNAYLEHQKDWNAMCPYVEDALRPVWGNARFEYYEAEDCSIYGPEEFDEYWTNNEESFLVKVFNSRKMAFSRVFNNH